MRDCLGKFGRELKSLRSVSDPPEYKPSGRIGVEGRIDLCGFKRASVVGQFGSFRIGIEDILPFFVGPAAGPDLDV